jgi:hypothetical protein
MTKTLNQIKDELTKELIFYDITKEDSYLVINFENIIHNTDFQKVSKILEKTKYDYFVSVNVIDKNKLKMFIRD